MLDLNWEKLMNIAPSLPSQEVVLLLYFKNENGRKTMEDAYQELRINRMDISQFITDLISRGWIVSDGGKIKVIF